MQYQSIFLRRSIISFIFTILAVILSYVFRFFLAQHTSVAQFGLFYSMLSFFTFLLIFVELGFGPVMIKTIVTNNLQKKRVAQTEAANKELLLSAFLFQLVITAIIVIITIIFADVILNNFFHTAETYAKLAFLLMALWFLTQPIFYFFNALYLGFQRTSWYALFDASKIIVSFILLLLFVFIPSINILNNLAPFLAYGLMNISLLLIGLPTIRYLLPYFFTTAIQLSLKKVITILRESIYIGLAGFSWIIITQIDTLLLTYFRTLEEVGLYQAALPFSTIFSFFSGALVIVLIPASAELYYSKKLNTLATLLSSLYKGIAMAILPLAVILAVFAKQIILFFFGSAYLASTVAVQYFAASAVFYVFAMINGTVLNSIGNGKTVFRYTCLVCIMSLLLNLLLIPNYGIIGATISNVISFLVLLVASLYSLMQRVPFLWFTKETARLLAVTILFAILLITLKSTIGTTITQGIISITVALAVYIALLSLCKITAPYNILRNSLQELVKK